MAVGSSTPVKTNHPFMLQVMLSDEQIAEASGVNYATPNDNSKKCDGAVNGISFCISVFEQIPRTFLVRGSLLNKELSCTPYVHLYEKHHFNVRNMLKHLYLLGLNVLACFFLLPWHCFMLSVFFMYFSVLHSISHFLVQHR